MSDWLKWKKRFLRKWKSKIQYLKIDKWCAWYRHNAQNRSFNSWNMVRHGGSLWEAVLYFRAHHKGKNIEIDVFNQKGDGVTVWVTPQINTNEPKQLSLFGG